MGSCLSAGLLHKCQQGLGLDWAEAETRNSIQITHMYGKNPTTPAITTAPGCISAGSWRQELEASIQPKYSNSVPGYRNCCPNAHPVVFTITVQETNYKMTWNLGWGTKYWQTLISTFERDSNWKRRDGWKIFNNHAIFEQKSWYQIFFPKACLCLP